MNARELIETITAAFPLKPVPAAGPQATHASDAVHFGKITESELEAATAKDAHRTWQQYPDEELAMLDAALAHLQIEGFIYYLPAYLCAAVRHASRNIDDPWSMFVCQTCFQVTGRSDYQLQRFQRLTATQSNAVIRFLEFMVENADDHEAERARKALNRYWLNPKRRTSGIVLP
jgi:hypothetical protein